MSLKKVSELNTKAPPPPPRLLGSVFSQQPGFQPTGSSEALNSRRGGGELVEGVGRPGEPAWVTFLGKGIGLKTWKKNQEFMGSATQGHFV